MVLKDEIDKVLHRISVYWKHKCVVCGCEKSKSGMVIHHLWYIDNDIIYKNYPQNLNGRLRYLLDLEPLIKNNPKRFRYYCSKDHYAVGKVSQYGDEKWKAICRERALTKTHIKTEMK